MHAPNSKSHRGTLNIVVKSHHGPLPPKQALRTISPSPITAQNIVPGQKRDQSSYRAELGGIYMSIKLTNTICRKKQISTGKVTLGCDCKGAIQAVKGDQIVSSCLNSYDLLYHIQKEIRQSPIDWLGI